MKKPMSFLVASSVAIISPLGAALAFWLIFGAMVGGCIDHPAEPPPAQAKLVAHWDPLACGDPHRVVVELEDDGGAPLAGSTPCNLGGFTLDVPHYGMYWGRVYAWAPGEIVHDSNAVQLSIDASVVQWEVATP